MRSHTNTRTHIERETFLYIYITTAAAI